MERGNFAYMDINAHYGRGLLKEEQNLEGDEVDDQAIPESDSFDLDIKGIKEMHTAIFESINEEDGFENCLKALKGVKGILR
jgi:hypothetical protein